MKNFFVFVCSLLMFACSPAHAIGTPGAVAVMVATRGGVHPATPEAIDPVAVNRVCLFQIPGKLHVINLAHVSEIKVTEDREMFFQMGGRTHHYYITNGDSDGSFAYVVKQWRECR